MKRMGWLLAVGVVLTAMGTADAAVLCTKKTGAVVIRDACKKKERAMNLADFGASGPQGAPGATGPGVFVVDANGALVGPVVDELNILTSPPMARVVRKLGNDVVSIPVDPAAGFPETASLPPVFFANAGCSGQSYVIPPPIPTFALAFTTIIHGGVAYYAVSSAASHTFGSLLAFFITPVSCTGAGGTVVGADGCCLPSASSATLSPSGSFNLATLNLVAPFHAVAP